MIIVAGATGQLGNKIAHHLRANGAGVRLLVRPGHPRETMAALGRFGAVLEVDFVDHAALSRACAGGSCVVSALSGLEDVILGAQTRLLDAAVEARVPRFIPSDFCIDFTKIAPGRNRNLDLRRRFAARLDQADIAPTTIFNGMFSDLLIGKAPLILFPLRTVVYWGSADQSLDFTTMDDTAAFTAAAAMDPTTPRVLSVAGAVANARELRDIASAVTGKTFHLVKAGSVGRLDLLSRATRKLVPQNGEVFPAWQGMQYLRDMFEGDAKLTPYDNNRYPIAWTPLRDVLARRDQVPTTPLNRAATT